MGVDDGRHERGWAKTLLVASKHCWRESTLLPVEATAGLVAVDGCDSTEAIAELVRRLGGASAVLLDSTVFAGFNVADPLRLWEELRTPIIVVQLYEVDLHAAASVLRRLFRDWRDRLAPLLVVHSLLRWVDCPRGRIGVAPVGLSYAEAWRIVCELQRFARTPEPLRTAHIVASSLTRRCIEEGGAPWCRLLVGR